MSPPDAPLPPPASPQPPASPANLPPDRVAGRFRLRAELARGGMGVVYRADEPGVGREVAVKLLHERLRGQPAAARRFVREARLTAQLQHPGVPPVFEVGALPDGSPFLAMKLIAGRTLADLMDEGADDPTRLLPAFEQVCQTVAYAHARGVIHRDLKPQNVMVGEFGEVQVMDWGLAKALTPAGRAAASGAEPPDAGPHPEAESEANDAPDATRTGQVLGTPAYMAPEQARGEPADCRADVFALGAVLCELLTGGRPYGPASPELAVFRAKRGMLDEVGRLLGGCRADPELVALARRCLAADAADRPADAGEVARAVKAYQDGVRRRLAQEQADRAAAEARAEEQAARTAVERQKRRRTAALAAAVAASLLLGTLGTAVAAYFINDARQLAEDNAGKERAAKQEVQEQAGVLERQRDDLSKQAAKLAAQAGRLRSNLQKAKSQSKRYFNLVKNTPFEDRRIGDVLEFRKLRDDLAAMVDEYRKEYTAHEGEDPDFDTDLAEAIGQLAYLCREMHDPTEAARLHAEQADILARLTRDHPDQAARWADGLAGAHNDAALALMEQGQPGPAEAAFGKALAVIDALPADARNARPLRELGAQIHNNLGNVYGGGRPEQALAAYRTAHAGMERLEAEDAAREPTLQTIHLAMVESNIGKLLNTRGDRPAALDWWAKAGKRLDAAGRVSWLADSMLLLEARGVLGVNLAACLSAGDDRRPAEALRHAEAAAATWGRLADQYPKAVRYKIGLGRAWMLTAVLVRDSAGPAAAADAATKAIRALDGLSAEHEEFITVSNDLSVLTMMLAVVAAADGAWDRAVRQADAAAQKLTAVVERQPDYPNAANMLALTRRFRADLLISAGRYADALEAIDALPPPAPPFTPEMRELDRAVCVAGLGREYALAITDMKRAVVKGKLLRADVTVAAVYALASKAALADPDEELTAADRTARVERYQREAVRYLRLAHEGGRLAASEEDLVKLRKGVPFDPLRGRDDFQQLLKEVEAAAKAKPARPAAADK